MLILCSNGLSSTILQAYLQQHLTGCKRAALVVTADNVYKEKNYNVARCVKELTAIGLAVDILDLDKDDSNLLLNYDVVEFIGGNPYYLLHSIRSCHAEEILQTIAKGSVLIGWSAAAFVFGPTLELVNIYSPEMNFLGLTDLTALALTDVEVLPHYSKFCSNFDRFEERCSEYEQQYNVNVIRLNDGDGLVISRTAQSLIRAEREGQDPPLQT